MADETSGAPAAAATPPAPLEAPVDSAPAASPEAAKDASAPTSDQRTEAPEPATSPADQEASDKPAKGSEESASEKPTEPADAEMKDAAAVESESGPTMGLDGADDTRPDAAAIASGAEAAATLSKSKSRRKSQGASDTKAKKLNKKSSKARFLHLDAKPGDHYFVKLKGFPQWPAIICDEDMLPQALIKTRPVTAVRPDGTYREDYADGGKRVNDRTFPVMYLHTNEFGWVPNTDLIDLDPETVMDVKMDKMRKDLQEAHKLASENHSLDYYKGVLQQFQEDLLQQQKAKEAKAQATPAKKTKKAKAEAEDDEDVEMADATVVAEAEETEVKEKKTKKRKAEENAETPQRSDSVKKPKIKLTTNSTPKTTNGVGSTPKSSKPQSEAKSSKSKTPKKSNKEAEDKKAEKEVATPKEPELSAEERLARKEKEVLFLRHKLQKGLLTRDQEPKEDEMKLMSDYITKLESFPDLEVSTIKATKINKVLKAILKLDSIPKEEEFQFKPRSQFLLDKWTKLLAVDGGETANGVNGTSGNAPTGKGQSKTNGVKEKSGILSETPKGTIKSKEKDPATSADDKSANEETKESEAVEASA